MYGPISLEELSMFQDIKKRIDEYNKKVSYYKLLSTLSPEVEDDLRMEYKQLATEIGLLDGNFLDYFIKNFRTVMIESIDNTFAGPTFKK